MTGPSGRMTVSEQPLTARRCGRVTVVSLTTPSLRGPVLDDVCAALARLAGGEGGGSSRMAVSLEQAQDVTAAAVSKLAPVARRCESLGGRFVLFGAAPGFERIVRASKLRKALPIERDEALAVAAAEGRPRRVRWPMAA